MLITESSTSLHLQYIYPALTMSGSTSKLNGNGQNEGSISNLKHNDDVTVDIASQRNGAYDSPDFSIGERSVDQLKLLERKLVRKIDLRLCTIAGILCSLNLLDSGIISSASVTTIFEDLGLGLGNRYVSFSAQSQGGRMVE